MDEFVQKYRIEREIGLEKSITSYGSNLSTFVYDYTYWDEMVKFTKTQDKDWAYQNIETAISSYSTDYVWIYSTNFNLIYSISAPGMPPIKTLPLDKSDLKQIMETNKFSHFFLQIDSLVYEIRTAPIQPSADLERTSPSQGYFIAGKCWNAKVLDDLSTLTGLKMSLFSSGTDLTKVWVQKNRFAIMIPKTLFSWDEQPVAHLISVDELMFMDKIAAYGKTQFRNMFVSQTLVTIIIYIFLVHNLGRPLSTISNSLEQSNPQLLANLKNQKNEFGNIAALIDQFFQQKEKLVQEYEERNRIERRYQDIMDNAPLGIQFFKMRPDRKLVLMGANQAADLILNRNHNQLIGLTIEEVFPTFPPTGILEAYRRVVETGERYDADHVEVERDGVRRTFEIHAFLFGPNLVGVFFQDVTEKKYTENALRASEEKLRNLVENMLDLVWQTDDNGKIIYVSPNIIDLLGYQPEEIIGQLFAQLLASEDRSNLDQEVAKAIQNQYNIRGISINLLHKNGYPVAFEMNATPLFDSEQECIGFVGIGRDITLRRQMEAEQIKIQKLESLGVLAGGISHDFNNILTGILGNISLANMSTDDPKIKTLLDEAEKASLDARDLVRELLTFARGGSPIKIKSSIEENIRESTKLALSGTRVNVSMNFSEHLPPVAVDRGQINQVIQNIIINAVQAMPQGGKISIEVDLVSGLADLPTTSERYIRVRITDTGVGIPEENLKRIFDPYFTTKEFGSGLGLSVTYSIIKKHGGHISVVSQVGKGTTFSVFLPAEADEESQAGTVQKNLQGSGHILLVDDEKMILDVAQAMLKKLGYTVTCAKEGRQAIEKYLQAKQSDEPFDAVIMDLTIVGGMGGKDAIRELRKVDLDIPAIASSGYATDPIMAEPQAYGFDGVISKPYNMQILGTELHRVLKSRSARIG